MMIILLYALFFTPCVWAEDYDAVMTIHRIEIETAEQIQSQVLNPILGPGQSSVFVKLALETRSEGVISNKAGEGGSTRTTKKKSKDWSSEEFNEDSRDKSDEVLAEFSAGTRASTGPATQLPLKNTKVIQKSTNTMPSEASFDVLSKQEARQTKAEEEQYHKFAFSFPTFIAVILHDSKAQPEKLQVIREAVIAAYDLKPDANIRFIPVAFTRPKPK
jgi:hypothetical protein